MRFFTILVCFFGVLYAQEPTLDSQIEMLKSAPASERHQLMNAIKQRIANMNALEREAALQKLQNGGATQVHMRMGSGGMRQESIQTKQGIGSGGMQPQNPNNQQRGRQ